jgi:transcriptional regulator with XRE-family HTH domain
MAKKTATEREFSIAFGKVLRRIRDERDLSQEAFGNLLGLHRTHIGFIERGERTPLLDTVFDISVVLGISMPDLMEQTVQEYKAHYKATHRPEESGPKKTS